MTRFFEGLKYNFKGMRYLIKSPSLWRYAIIPFLINLAFLTLLFALYTTYFNDIFLYITKPLSYFDIQDPQGILWIALDGLGWIVRQLLKIVFLILSVIFIFVVVYFLSSLVNSPFYELLAEAVLVKEGRRVNQSFSFKQFWSESIHSIKIEGLKLLLFTGISVVLFVLQFVPVVGIVFYIIGFLFTSWLFAFGLCGYPLLLEGKGFSDLLRWAFQRKSLLIGFGCFSLIPFLSLLFIYFQVVGGTLLFIDEGLEVKNV